MRNDIDSAVLAKTSLFQSLDPGDQDLLAIVMKRRELADGEALYEKGDAGDSLAVIVEGALRAQLDADDVVRLQRYEVVGEMTCIDPAPRSATVRADGDATVAILDRNTLMMLRDTAPRVFSSVLWAVTRNVTARLLQTNATIEERYPAGKFERPRMMTTRDEPETFGGRIDLRELACLQDFAANELGLLAAVAEFRRYPAGAVLCSEGDGAETCFIVADGEVEVRKTISGMVCVLGSVETGTLLGQASLVDSGERSATLVAREETVTVEITQETFEKLRGACTPLAIRFQELIAVSSIRQLRMANERLSQIPHFAESGSEPTRPELVGADEPTTADEESSHGFAREDTVKRFLDSALLQAGVSVDEVDSVDFEGVENHEVA